MAQSSTEYALYLLNQKVKGQDWGAVKHIVSSSFVGTITGGSATNGVVNMVVVPMGAKIIDGRLRWGALGTGQLYVGDSFVCTRYMLAADASVGSDLQVGLSPFAGGCGRFNNITWANYVATCDQVITVSATGGNPVSTAVGTATPLILEVHYVMV
jgi:hypothetical protein